MKTKHSFARGGFSFVDLLLIVAAVAGIFFVLLPTLTRSHRHRPGLQCSNNLKQISISFRIWAGDNNDKTPTQVSQMNGGAMELAETGSAYAVFLVLSNELNTPKILFCPNESNPKRRMASIFASTVPPGANEWTIPFTETNSISYFVGLDATDTKPEMILTGDDHFDIAGVKPKPGLFLLQTNAPVEWRNERHPKQGNVSLADGSVQGFSTATFRRALVQTGIATNRLAMP